MTGQSARYQQHDNVFKEYVVQMYLGKGGFGEVYQVVNDIGLPFALKVLHGDVYLDPRGAEAVKQIQSTRLVQIQDFGKTRNGEGCILMEYVQDTLESVMTDQGPKPEEAHHYLTEILKGLKTLHENGIVHQNITPLNLFVQEDIVKIGDFGTARCTTGESKRMSRGNGTCHYMAPERFTQNFSFGVDLWSAGVVFYRLLTGRHPFDGEDNRRIFEAIMQEEADLEDFSQAYRLFFTRVFQKKPADRYQTPADMLAGLKFCTPSKPPAQTPAPVAPPVQPVFSAPQAGDTFTESHTGMVFMYVPRGTFGDIDYGSAAGIGWPNTQTLRLKGFWMGRYPVTVGQWRQFIEDTGYSGDGADGWRCTGMASPEIKQTEDHPVVCVSWLEAQAFAQWLSAKSGAQYRLPTEKEWEYAACSGTGFMEVMMRYIRRSDKSKRPVGREEKYAGGKNLKALGWYNKNSGGSTRPVGRKAANDLGLHDMSGNVWEWCGNERYAVGPEHNPPEGSSDWLRMLRGGSWFSDAVLCRVVSRNWLSQTIRNADIGFRLLRVPDVQSGTELPEKSSTALF